MAKFRLASVTNNEKLVNSPVYNDYLTEQLQQNVDQVVAQEIAARQTNSDINAATQTEKSQAANEVMVSPVRMSQVQSTEISEREQNLLSTVQSSGPGEQTYNLEDDPRIIRDETGQISRFRRNTETGEAYDPGEGDASVAGIDFVADDAGDDYSGVNLADPENYGFGYGDQGASAGGGSSGQGPSSNVLHNYPNFTYGISLHYMTIEKYNSVIVKGQEYTTSDGTVLIASGGRNNNELSRNSVFNTDMYFQDFKMTCVIGHNNKSRGSNAIDISFTVIEPLGMSLLDKILEVADNAGVKQWDQMPFVIQIDFFANDESGGLVNPIPNTTKRICVKIIDMQIKIGINGSVYKITAIPQNHVAFLQTNSTTPANLEVMAKKVKDFFASDADPGEAGNSNQSRGDSGQPGGKQAVKTYSYTAALNAFQKQKKELRHQETADVYKFEFDSEIGDSEIFIPEKQPSNRSPVQNDINKNQNYEREKGLIPINAGTYIKEVINFILKASKFYRDQIKDDNNSNEMESQNSQYMSEVGQTPLKSHKITTTVEYGDWDNIRKTYQKTITFKINVYEYYNTKYPEAKRGIPAKADKEYYYMYTGKNQDILNFDIDFNTMFFTALTAMEKKYQQDRMQQVKEDQKKPDPVEEPGGSQKLQVVRIIHNISDTQNSTQFTTQDKKYVESSDLFKSKFDSARGDMINVHLTIAGDPSLIKQDDVFSSLNNSIATDKKELFCKLEFRLPEDINQQTGLYTMDRNSVFSGIYKCLTVENTFERGQFTQKLDLIRLFDQPGDTVTTGGGSSNNSNSKKIRDLGKGGVGDASAAGFDFASGPGDASIAGFDFNSGPGDASIAGFDFDSGPGNASLAGIDFADGKQNVASVTEQDTLDNGPGGLKLRNLRNIQASAASLDDFNS